MDFLTDYLSEIILIVGIGFLKLLGREASAEKLKKKFKKKRLKQEKIVKKESAKLERDFEKLKELENGTGN